jgi:hypothetical protein
MCVTQEVCVVEDTGSHKLLHTAAREGRVLWSYEVQIEPVCHLNVRAQLERIIFILVRNIDQESSCEIVQDVVPNDHWLAGHTCNGAELSSVR